MLPVLHADAALLARVAALPHPAWLNALMLGVSAAGRGGLVWLVLAAVAAFRMRGPALMAAWRVLLAVALTAIVADHVLKPLAGRPRPFAAVAGATVIGDRPASASFPSGHAAHAAAGAFSLSLMWRRPRWLWWTLALLIAASRIYLGVHYPLDVAGGLIVGWLCAWFATAGVKLPETAARS